MCGIIGLFRRDGLRSDDDAKVDSAMRRIRLRGPDGSGSWSDGRVQLGHTRLAIVDPSAGQQPWIDEVSGTVLVFNGEIYNFAELRVELTQKGHVFQSNCDTEVLLFAYLEWGKACLERLRGIYAFALYDPRQEMLWLVRDRLGVKPLYYRSEGDSWLFASSLAGLNALSKAPPKWNADAVSHYLMTARTELGALTLYEDALSLEPGTCLTIALNEDSHAIEPYWSVPRVREEDKLDLPFEELAENCRDLLGSAIGEQLLSSDVPVGGFLSGGLDSAILCGEIGEKQQHFTAYSIGYGRNSYNEWEAMRCTAQANGLNWMRVEAAESDFWTDWNWLVGNRGVALSTPNEVPIFRMAQAFSKDCKVALTGEGADEIFGGYAGPTFCAFDYDRSRSGAISEQALMRGYGVTQFGSRKEHFLRANSWMQSGEMSHLFPGLREATADFSGAADWYGSFFEATEALTTFDAYLHLHARVNLEGLLNRLDSSTMSASVEGRVPFTDHRLVELLFTLPDALKMRLQTKIGAKTLAEMNAFELDAAGAIQTKRLLRESFRERVPERILRRKKVSFPVPFLELLSGPLLSNAQEVLANAPALSDLLGIEELYAVLANGDPRSGLRAWLLVNLALAEQNHGIV